MTNKQALKDSSDNGLADELVKFIELVEDSGDTLSKSAFKEIIAKVRQHSKQSEWASMDSAPKDGTPVLLKFKDDMSQFDKTGKFRMSRWNSINFVGRNRGDVMLWGFAAPVGQGGFPDEWLDGWQPLPSPPGKD